MVVLLLETSYARKAQSPFQHVNAILDSSESLEDLDARIKKAKEIKDELEQMEAAIEDLKKLAATKEQEIKDLEKRAATKKKEMKAMKCSKDYLDDKKVCSSFASVAFCLTTLHFVLQLALLMKDREHLTKARETMKRKFTAGDEEDQNPDEKPGPSKKCNN